MKISVIKNIHSNRENCNMLFLLLKDAFGKTKYKNKQHLKLSEMSCEEYEKNKQKRGIKKLRALQERELKEYLAEKDVKWFDLLDYTKNGNVRRTLKNKATILTNDPKLSAIVFNEQSGKIWLSGETPWSSFEKEFKDTDFAALKHYFSKYYNLECSNKLFDAVLYVSKERGFKPIKDYLTKLPSKATAKIGKDDMNKLWLDEKKNLC